MLTDTRDLLLVETEDDNAEVVGRCGLDPGPPGGRVGAARSREALNHGRGAVDVRRPTREQDVARVARLIDDERAIAEGGAGTERRLGLVDRARQERGGGAPIELGRVRD